VRLLGEAERHGNDPELFAGLVHACRYCGLFEQSIAAHEEARRLDPNVPTSVEGTLLLAGQFDRLLATARPADSDGDTTLNVIALGLMGRRDEAHRALAEHDEATRISSFHAYAGALAAWLDRRPADLLAGVAALGTLRILEDPEALFQMGWLLCDIGEHERGLAEMRRAVGRGYAVAPTLRTSRSFDAVRGKAAFQELLARAEADRERALAAFRESGGERLLGR
jgi:tetratricopeptide (TPR) repeat protein